MESTYIVVNHGSAKKVSGYREMTSSYKAVCSVHIYRLATWSTAYVRGSRGLQWPLQRDSTALGNAMKVFVFYSASLSHVIGEFLNNSCAYINSCF